MYICTLKIRKQLVMKKTILTIAIVFGLSLSTFAQWGGGLFQRGAVSDEVFYGNYYGYQNRLDDGNLIGPAIPYTHDLTDDQGAPLCGGALLLIGFGAAYALKKRKEEK